MTAKDLIKKRFERGFRTYDSEAKVQLEIARKLVSRISENGYWDFDRVLEVGAGTGFFTNQAFGKFQFNDYVLNDLVRVLSNRSGSSEVTGFKGNKTFIEGDAEITDFPGRFDAVFSTSTFHWFQNLELFFHRISQKINNNGLFAFSTFGCDNFMEIKESLNVGLEYKCLDTIINYLKNDFDILVSEEWNHEEWFYGPFDVLRHIRQTGVNALKTGYLGKQKLSDFQRFYIDHYSNPKGQVHLTYHPIIVIAKKK